MKKKVEEYYHHNSKTDSTKEDMFQSLVSNVNEFVDRKGKAANIVLSKQKTKHEDGEERLILVIEVVSNDKQNYIKRSRRG